MAEIIHKNRDYYRKLALKYGEAPEANSWDRAAQVFRWEQLLRLSGMLCDAQEGGSLLDFGCGTGDLYGYLSDREDFPAFRNMVYQGIDVVPEMIDIAKMKYPGQDRFRVLNILEEKLDGQFTYILVNGVFNVVFAEEEEAFAYMRNILRILWDHTGKGLCFNFISTYANWKDPEMMYFNPVRVMDFCINTLSWKVTMTHHYEKCDVCVWVEKKA